MEIGFGLLRQGVQFVQVGFYRGQFRAMQRCAPAVWIFLPRKRNAQGRRHPHLHKRQSEPLARRCSICTRSRRAAAPICIRDRILFGTDFSTEVIESTVNELPHPGLSARLTRAIERKNAEKPFPRFKVA